MSHFEYVSVATALIYALTIGHLLSGLRPAMDVSRRYWVHLVWVFVLLFVTVMAWWLMWNASGVAWTPLRFLWALSLPALIFVRASVLLGNSDDPPDSYFDHFYEQRALFFAIGLGVSIYIAFSPWILNLAPWFNIMPVHYNAVSLLAVSGIGLFFRNPAVHGGIAVYSLISVIAFFFALPGPVPL